MCMFQSKLIFVDSQCVANITGCLCVSVKSGPGRIVVGFTTVPITTKVVSSNPVHGEVYSIQHYDIM